jgi:DNA-binding CsgD family transcriptional regulator
MFIFIVARKKDSKKNDKNPLLLTLLISLYTLFIFILLDYTGFYLPGGFGNSINYISLTVTGYFLLCISTVVFFFRYYASRKPTVSITDPVFIYFDARGITQREVEIISLITKGYSNRQIGEKLFISLSTVKKHVYSIFRKVNVKSRMALTVLIRKKSEKDF